MFRRKRKDLLKKVHCMTIGFQFKKSIFEALNNIAYVRKYKLQ
jgi:hypothetical protein